MPQLSHPGRSARDRFLARAVRRSAGFDEADYKVIGANITPDKETGIGNWSDAALKKFLVTGVKPNGIRAAPIMPYEFYTVLTARDLDALVAYLKTVPPLRRETPAPEYRKASKPETPTYSGAQMTDAQMADKLSRGRYLLNISHCLECHTPEGPSAVHDFASATGKGGRKFLGPWGESQSRNITSHPYPASANGATTRSSAPSPRASAATAAR